MCRCSLIPATTAAAFLAAVASAPGGSVPPPTELTRMWAVPELLDVDRVDWFALPQLRGESAVILHGVDGESGHAHHPSVIHFDGRYIAAWNDGFRLEDRPGQRVRFATSVDGLNWSAPEDVTGRHPRRRYTTGGLWLRGNELYLLAALRDARDVPPTGEDPLLLAYRWDTAARRFDEGRVILRDFFAQNVPQQTPDGDWLMLGKGGGAGWGTMKAAKGGTRALDEWEVRDLPTGSAIEEPEWYPLPGGDLVAHFRTRPPKRLMRSYSADAGVTWTAPVLTDFPEASARHHGLRLASGLYVLLVNPNTTGQRLPFSIALSRDGLLYDRIANVRADSPRAGHGSERPGFHYMRGWEHAGRLITIYSVNQIDIGVTVVPVAEIEALYAGEGASP